MVFKKFDNGWQLLEQGKSGSDLVNSILDSDINSNRKDDYSQIIIEKQNEAYEKANENQAKYTDINEFLSALKRAVKSKDKKEISKFMSFPFETDNALTPARNIDEVDSNIGIPTFDGVLNANTLQKYNENDFGIPGTSMKFSKHKNGYWKMDAAYGSPDFER